MSKVDALIRMLENLRAAVPDLTGVLLASTEGLTIAHSVNGGSDPGRVAAMAAAAAGLGKRISDSLNQGGASEVSVTGVEGALYVYAAGSKAILAVLAPAGANSGLIHLEARLAAGAVGRFFNSGQAVGA